MKTIWAANWMVLGCACVALMAAGCNSAMTPTNAKLEQAMNTYFEGHNECLFPTGRSFPYEVTPGSDAKTDKKQMDAMRISGLLTEEDDFETHVPRYKLTALGQRMAPRFCYGHKVVTSVDGFTVPVKQGNVMETTATYHAKMIDVPVWTQTDELEAAFPQMGAAISGPQPGQIVVATAGVGWAVR